MHNEHLTKQGAINSSYVAIKGYDERLKVAGRNFADTSKIEESLETRVRLSINASGVILFRTYTVAEVDRQILGLIFSFIHYPLENFVDADEGVYLFMENTLEKKDYYMPGLLKTTAAFREKAKDLKAYFYKMNWIFISLSLGFVLIMMLLIYILYLSIHKSKLFVMSFFVHIQTKSLEEILINCDEFITALTSIEVRIADEQLEREVVIQCVEEETGSYTSKSQLQFSRKYKTHHTSHRRMLEDDCHTLFVATMKIILLYLLVSSYIVGCYLIEIVYNSSLNRAGDLSETNSRVEMESIKLLVLMKESINIDTESTTLSDLFTQVVSTIEGTIELMKGLEDVNYVN